MPDHEIQLMVRRLLMPAAEEIKALADAEIPELPPPLDQPGEDVA